MLLYDCISAHKGDSVDLAGHCFTSQEMICVDPLYSMHSSMNSLFCHKPIEIAESKVILWDSTGLSVYAC